MNKNNKMAVRLLSLLLVPMLLISIFQLVASAYNADALSSALDASRTFIDNLTLNSSANGDPSAIVTNTSQFFSWDNEKRASPNKQYLFEWSYYNGVVMEGMKYIADAEGASSAAYADYAEEYLDAMISNGALNTYAGYVDYHGLDCYKTASLLLDYVDFTSDTYTSDPKYLVATTLYDDLQTAKTNYTSSAYGGNYYHSWTSVPAYKVWLDGIYMAQPFMAEYAYKTGDTAELNAIFSRFQWIYNNMRAPSTGLYYHGANSSTDYVNYHWGRAIGWYIMAMVDVMPYMTGANLTSMQVMLKDLIDNMLPYRDADTMMWKNLVDKSLTTTNRTETSGTAMMVYGIMKGVNNLWLPESYAEYAIESFVGMNNEKLTSGGLTDIYFKASANGTDNYNTASNYYTNEGKGFGPYIMAYAQLRAYQLAEENSSATLSLSVQDGIPVNELNQYEVDITETTSAIITGTAVTDGVTISSWAWQSSNTSVATVTGLTATPAVSFVGVGTADITCTLTLSDGATKTETVTFSVIDSTVVEWTDLGSVNEDYYERISSLNELVDGEQYVVVYTNANYALACTSSNALTRVNGTKTTVGSQARWTPANTSSLTLQSFLWTYNRVSSTTGRFSVNYNGNTYYLYPANYSYVSTSAQTITLSMSGTSFRLYGSRYLRYSSNAYSSTRNAGTTCNMAIYKPVITQNGYAAVTGSRRLEYRAETMTAADITSAIQSGASVLHSSDAEHTETQTVAWSDPAVSFSGFSVMDPNTPGAYTIAVLYNDTVVGYVYITITDARIPIGLSLSGVSTFAVERGHLPDLTGCTITVTYDDGTTETYPLENSMLVGTGYNLTANGIYTGVDVSFEGLVLDDAVTISVRDVIGDNFPSYPRTGSIVVDKTAKGIYFNDTGAAKVELTVDGIPANNNLDIVLIVDISNSMTWGVGEYEDTPDPTDPDRKINAARTAAKNFTDLLLADNPDGTPSTNTISLVSFAAIDQQQNTMPLDYDEVRTEIERSSDATAVDAAIDAITTATEGGTCYDYAFYQATGIVDNLLAYNQANNLSGRESIVIFLTDGAPTYYNGAYYKASSTADAPRSMTYVDPATGTVTDYLKSGLAADGTDIDATSTNGSFTADDGTTYSGLTYNSGWTNYILNNRNIFWEELMERDITMITVGFDLEYGNSLQGATTAMPNVTGNSGGTYYILPDTLSTLLESMASTPDDFYSAHEATELTDLYKRLAGELLIAGATQSYVVDLMGAAYDMLTVAEKEKSDGSIIDYSDYGITPSIEFVNYETYTMADVESGLVPKDKYGIRKVDANGDYIERLVERVTFSDDGTQAYSDILGSTTNILVDGVLTGENFVYDFNTEELIWNSGNIFADSIALRYYVYLTGSLEGEALKAVYQTNESATLYYKNYLGNTVSRVFPVPSLPWGDAAVSYAFYLANSDGQPVARDGTLVPFSYRECISYPAVYGMVEHNSYETLSVADLQAQGLFPEAYTPYDADASYTIYPSSEPTGGNWAIVTGAGLNDSTYVADYGGDPTKALSGTDDSYDYSNTTVWFAVVWQAKIVPDTVVIDYGLPVEIDVLSNDLVTGALTGIASVESMPVGETASTHAIAYGNALTCAHGTVTSDVDYNAVTYTPTDMNMVEPDVFSYEVSYSYTDTTGNLVTTFLYTTVTVIPATFIYYEDNFITYSGNWTQVGSPILNAKQDTDRPGFTNVNDDANNIYGYDSQYGNCLNYSLGSAMKVNVSAADRNAWPTATFDFTGTGFDLISVTNNTTGTIFVEVKDLNNNSTVAGKYVVDTYYGYSYDGSAWNVNHTSSDTLWNIPVIKVANLDYSHYEVEVSVRYSPFFDHIPGSTDYDFIFDAVRIYDPAGYNGANSVDAYDAYEADNESLPEYDELRNMLISAESFNSGSEEIDGVVFIDGLEALGSDNMLSYRNYGPNNEVYLAYGQSLAFNIYSSRLPDGIHFSGKLARGNNATILVGNTRSIIGAKTKRISTSVDMFYDIGQYGVWQADEVRGGHITQYPIFITNTTPGSVLSITDVKCTYENTEPVLMSLFFDASAVQKVYSMSRQLMGVDVPEKPTVEVTETTVVTEPVTGEGSTQTQPTTEAPTENITEQAPETKPEQIKSLLEKIKELLNTVIEFFRSIFSSRN